MLVKGIVTVDVDFTLKDALKVLTSKFGFADDYGEFDEDLLILEKTDERNITNELGLFRIIDKAYHGSPKYEYTLITHDKEKIENFKHLEALIKNSKNI